MLNDKPINIRASIIITLASILVSITVGVVAWTTTVKAEIDDLQQQTQAITEVNKKLVERLHRHDVQDAVNDERIDTLNKQLEMVIEQNAIIIRGLRRDGN